MSGSKKEIYFEMDIVLHEAGGDYPLHLTLFKTQFRVEDHEGNYIWVDKRDRRMLVEVKDNDANRIWVDQRNGQMLVKGKGNIEYREA